MSLFKTKEWWTTRLGSDEEFDAAGVVVSNFDAAEDGQDKIIVGSLAGVLRILQPSSNDYQVKDLLLEEDLGSPILQVLVGRFVPKSDGLALALLHPRRLTGEGARADEGGGIGGDPFWRYSPRNENESCLARSSTSLF